jgi:predicted DNA-binding transcriptional regulator YafY
MVNLLRAKKRLSMDELVSECLVSKRTVFRDLLALAELNIPVRFNHGYHLDGKIHPPILNLNREEQELLAFCLESSSLARAPYFKNRIQNMEMKILSALADGNNHITNHYFYFDGGIMGSLSSDEDKLVQNFIHALLKKEDVDLVLKLRDKSIGRIRPMALKIRNNKWIFQFYDKKGGRTFNIAMERIKEIRKGRSLEER